MRSSIFVLCGAGVLVSLAGLGTSLRRKKSQIRKIPAKRNSKDLLFNFFQDLVAILFSNSLKNFLRFGSMCGVIIYFVFGAVFINSI